MSEEEETHLANVAPHFVASSHTMGSIEADSRSSTGTEIAGALTGSTQASGSTQSVATVGTMNVATAMGMATGR